eukprot:g20096.t1
MPVDTAARSATWTFVEGEWLEGNPKLIGPTSHAMWLGSTVFDGARWFDGISPDLDLHCQRVNRSATNMGMKPTMTAEEIERLALEGVKKFDGKTAIYIKPMYWAEHGMPFSVVAPDAESTRFALCLFEAPMHTAKPSSLTVSPYRRPNPEVAMTAAKTGSLYPNSGRMILDARGRGFDNALARDMNGNVAETASSNIFMVKDGVVMTPVANGTFLAGITRSRVIGLLRQAGYDVRETTLTVQDFADADEIFTSGNFSKIVPVTKFEERSLQEGPAAAGSCSPRLPAPASGASEEIEDRRHGGSGGRRVFLGLLQLGFATMRVARHASVESGIKDAGAASAFALGSVERHVGIADEHGPVTAVIGINSDAHARAHLDRPTFELDRSREIRLQRVGKQIGRARLLRRMDDQDEFVASEPAAEIIGCHPCTNARAGLLEQRIARHMAIEIVDVLEVIEIERDHGEGLGLLLLLLDRLLKLQHEAGAVEKMGQRIVMGEIADLPLGENPGGDVLLRRQDEAAGKQGAVDVDDPVSPLHVRLMAFPALDGSQHLIEMLLCIGFPAPEHPALEHGVEIDLDAVLPPAQPMELDERAIDVDRSSPKRKDAHRDWKVIHGQLQAMKVSTVQVVCVIHGDKAVQAEILCR